MRHWVQHPGQASRPTSLLTVQGPFAKDIKDLLDGKYEQHVEELKEKWKDWRQAGAKRKGSSPSREGKEKWKGELVEKGLVGGKL